MFALRMSSEGGGGWRSWRNGPHRGAPGVRTAGAGWMQSLGTHTGQTTIHGMGPALLEHPPGEVVTAMRSILARKAAAARATKEVTQAAKEVAKARQQARQARYVDGANRHSEAVCRAFFLSHRWAGRACSAIW